MGNHTLMMHWGWLQGQQRLPAGYRRVEYLESSGTQWIDTGVTPIIGDTLGCRFLFTDISTGYYTLISAGTGTYQFILLATKQPTLEGFNWKYFASGQAAFFNFSATKDIWYDLDITPTGVASIGKYAKTSSPEHELDAPTTLRIFLRANGSSPMYGRMSKFLYKRNDSPIRSFIPVVRIADSKPGLYDLCGSICPLTNTPFYVNAGTGRISLGERCSKYKYNINI